MLFGEGHPVTDVEAMKVDGHFDCSDKKDNWIKTDKLQLFQFL